MEREALKRVLEFVKSINLGSRSASIEQQRQVIAALEEALAQQAQETAGMLHIERLDQWLDASLKERKQREWAGLTDEEIDHQAKKDDHGAYFALGALWAGAKLKERNHGT